MKEKEEIINWDYSDWSHKGRIVEMSPIEYMERTNIYNRMEKSVFDKYFFKHKGQILYFPPDSEQSYKLIVEGIAMGNKIHIPWIEFDEKENFVDQEGFHRALVARDLGIEKIPVLVIGEMPKDYLRLFELAKELGPDWRKSLTEQINRINEMREKVLK